MNGMTRREKKILWNLFDAIEHASDVLDEMSGESYNEKIQSVLTEMQQMVIDIGNRIEDTEENCNAVVSELELLCEEIFQWDTAWRNGRLRRGMCENFGKSLARIRNHAERMIPTTIDIVFVPYQVSMWDSLESVWQAASKDENVTCYVIPIPYYEVQKDGTLGQMHYEGARYPAYVPVTHYTQYDIAKRAPDIIFFHNPYDGGNTVTRVPAEFYATTLKKYTDKLVYVPYMVSEEEGPAEHQCYMPGVLIADRVVVQPGKIYRKYCRIYTRIVADNGWENALPPAGEKFLPLDSPKFDKVMKGECESGAVPEKWKRAITRPDGTKKKVILYNVSINALLRCNEQMLDKLDYVLEVAYENRDDMVLLWRPHPLLLHTIDAMRPKLREAYLKRVEQFKNAEWGIYDDTPDPSVPMIVADAYYGGDSSIATVMRKAGKPILIQNEEYLRVHEEFQEKKTKLKCKPVWFWEKGVVYQNELWVVAYDLNALYHVALDTGEAHLAAPLEGGWFRKQMYSQMLLVGERLFILPMKAYHIAVYDIVQKKLKYYETPRGSLQGEANEYIYGAHYKGRLFLIGRYSNMSILEMDIETGETTETETTLDGQIGKPLGEMLKTESCCVIDHTLYIAVKGLNYILMYDMQEREWQKKKLDAGDRKMIEGVAAWGKTLILWDADSVMAVSEEGIFQKLCEIPKGHIADVSVGRNGVCLFLSEGAAVYYQNFRERNMIEIDCGGEWLGETFCSKKVIPLQMSGNTLICFSLYTNEILTIDKTHIRSRVRVLSEEIPAIEAESVFRGNTNIEGCFYQCNFRSFIAYLRHADTIHGKKSGKSIGEIVYRTIINELE